MKAYASSTAITHTRHLYPHGTNACLDFPLWEMAVPDDSMPALSIPSVGILGEKHGDFRLNGVRQKPLGALA